MQGLGFKHRQKKKKVVFKNLEKVLERNLFFKILRRLRGASAFNGRNRDICYVLMTFVFVCP